MDIDGVIIGLGKIIQHPEGKLPTGDDVRDWISSPEDGWRARRNLVAEYIMSWTLGKMDQSA